MSCHSNHGAWTQQGDFNYWRCSYQVALPRQQKRDGCGKTEAVSHLIWAHLSVKTVGLGCCTEPARCRGLRSFDLFINLCSIFDPTLHALIFGKKLQFSNDFMWNFVRLGSKQTGRISGFSPSQEIESRFCFFILFFPNESLSNLKNNLYVPMLNPFK